MLLEAKARTRNQNLGNKETPFFLVQDLNTKEFYFYVMAETEYSATTETCTFELYPDVNSNFYLDQELSQLVKANFHTSYTSEWASPTGSSSDFNTSKLFNGLPVYHMNTENFNVWLYKWEPVPMFSIEGQRIDRRNLPTF